MKPVIVHSKNYLPSTKRYLEGVKQFSEIIPHHLDILDQKYTSKKQISSKHSSWTTWFEPLWTVLLFNLLTLFFNHA